MEAQAEILREEIRSLRADPHPGPGAHSGAGRRKRGSGGRGRSSCPAAAAWAVRRASPPIRALAEELGATGGASRAAVDAGWIAHAPGVGRTGKTVGPQAVHCPRHFGRHPAYGGMSSSDVVVANNKDPDTAIFRYCC